MKKRNILLTWIITILFLLLTAWYGITIIWGISQEEAPFLVQAGIWGIVILILIPVMIMMIVTAVQRKKEINEEDDDDLSQY